MLVYPAENVTMVSLPLIEVSRIGGVNELPPFKSSATPPVASPAVMLALAVKFVFVKFKALAITVPPTAVKVTTVAGVGPLVSTTNVGEASPKSSLPAVSLAPLVDATVAISAEIVSDVPL